jgi:conjugal transfer pilus assembly protein TraD
MFKKKKKNSLFIGKGFALDDIKKENFIDIRQEDGSRKGHTFVFGTTRVGKTRLAENCILQDIAAGKNVVVIDPKVDVELFSSIYRATVAADRTDDLMLLTTLYPEYSIHLNVLANYFLEDEVINHVMAGVPADDEFFYNYAYEVTSVIVRSLIKIKKETSQDTTITFDEISRFVSYSQVKWLLTQLDEFNDEDTNKIKSLASSVTEAGEEYFGKVSSTLRGTLTQLTTGNLAKVAGRAKNNYFIDRIEKNKGAILYVQTGAMLQKQSAFILGKVVISMIQSVIGRFFAQGSKFETPLCVYIDEMSNCTYRGIEDLFNKAGGCNCYIMGLTQSPADIIAEIGVDRARKLFDNTNSKIFMRMNDIDSAKTLKTYAGKSIRYTTQLSLDGGIRSTEVEEEILQETDFTELNPREFFYFGFEGKFKGKTVPMKDSNLKIQLPRVIK